MVYNSLMISLNSSFIDIALNSNHRPRFSRGKVYYSADYQNFKESLKTELLKHNFFLETPATGAVELIIEFFKPVKPTSRRYGDVDNLAKGVLDVLKGLIYVDDSQVDCLQVRKSRGVEGLSIIVNCDD